MRMVAHPEVVGPKTDGQSDTGSHNCDAYDPCHAHAGPGLEVPEGISKTQAVQEGSLSNVRRYNVCQMTAQDM